MPALTLLLKAYSNHQLELIDEFLKRSIGNLNVKTETTGSTPNGWVRIAVSGDDQEIALNYLTKRFGRCPERIENVSKFLNIRGSIAALNQNEGNTFVDIGIFSPDRINATIPLHYLQAQLADGRKIALKKLIELYGFCQNLPLTIKILKTHEENHYIEAMLSDGQVAQYRKWTGSLLDRLVILGASFQEVESALKTSDSTRDIAIIETLGLFEQAIVCKLGTDAAGMIPKIGRNLRHATFCIFSPKRIIRFLGNSAISPMIGLY
jgi:hypothetical protein